MNYCYLSLLNIIFILITALKEQKVFKRLLAEVRNNSFSNSFGKRWDVQLDFVRQFKSELVRRLEGLVFEKKSILLRLG